MSNTQSKRQLLYNEITYSLYSAVGQHDFMQLVEFVWLSQGSGFSKNSWPSSSNAHANPARSFQHYFNITINNMLQASTFPLDDNLHREIQDIEQPMLRPASKLDY